MQNFAAPVTAPKLADDPLDHGGVAVRALQRLRGARALIWDHVEAAGCWNRLIDACQALLGGRCDVVCLADDIAPPAVQADSADGTLVLIPVCDPSMPEAAEWLVVRVPGAEVAARSTALHAGLLADNARLAACTAALGAELAVEQGRSSNLMIALESNREIGAAIGTVTTSTTA